MRIAVVGKYTNLLDSYKSLNEALTHGGIANGVKVHLDWVDSQVFEQPHTIARLEGVHGILVPGGFGERGTEGKIEAVQVSPGSTGCRSSASASACRWPSSRPPGISPGCPTPPRPSSGRATRPWWGC